MHRSTLAILFTLTALLSASSLAAGCVTVTDDDDDGAGEPDGGDPGDSDGGDGPGGGDGGDGPGGDAEPRTGAWEYSEYTPVTNDCGLDDEWGNGGGGFGIVNHGDGTFTVLPNDDTDPFDCEIEGGAYFCSDRAHQEAADPGLDATLIAHATVEGSFSSDVRGSGTQVATITCAGGDCAIVEAATGADFPCQFEVDFVVEWLGGAR